MVIPCIMRKISTKLLVMVITTAAIIAAVTTISISAARPAFAKLNCSDDGLRCSGGGPSPANGGGGGIDIFGSVGGSAVFRSGGFGVGTDAGVGGGGEHHTCDTSGVCQASGNGVTGFHVKGPGGNSGDVPPNNQLTFPLFVKEEKIIFFPSSKFFSGYSSHWTSS